MSVSSDEHTDVTEQVLLFAVSPPFGFSTGWVCGFLLGIFLVGIDWRLVFLLFVAVGFILQLLWVFLLRNRYRKPLNDPEIWRLVDTARSKMNITTEPSLWLHDSDGYALTIKSNVFEVLDSARYLLPYVLSEMKHKTLDKRFGRFVFSYIGLSLLAWIGYLIFNSLGPRGIDITLLLDSLLPSFIWIWVVNLIAVFSLAIAFYQVKKKGIDSEITKKHPQWKEALELLIDTDLVTSSTPLSFEKRLEYIQSH